MQEMQVQSLGREDPLEKGKATHSSILAWRIPWTEELEGCSPWGRKESDTTEPACLRSEGWGLDTIGLGWEDTKELILFLHQALTQVKKAVFCKQGREPSPGSELPGTLI